MSNSGKWLLIRVTDLNTGRYKANVKIPASLADFGMKVATRYAPDSVEGLGMDGIVTALQNGGESKLVDVDNEEKGEHVEIFIA
jgi:hypothetical protein